MTNDQQLRRAVQWVALANLAYFGVEFVMALRIGSVSLLADSADFFEDAAVNFLIVMALAWSATQRARVGKALAGVLLLPAIAFLWALWSKIGSHAAPDAVKLSLTGAGAMIVNLVCAFNLARFRQHGGSLAKAAFLSARNDVLANIAIILAGGLTVWTRSPWPDIVAGLGIAAMNIDAAREVWRAAAREQADDLGRP